MQSILTDFEIIVIAEHVIIDAGHMRIDGRLYGYATKHARFRARRGSRKLHGGRAAPEYDHGVCVAGRLRPGGAPAHAPSEPHDAPHRADRSGRALFAAL